MKMEIVLADLFGTFGASVSPSHRISNVLNIDSTEPCLNSKVRAIVQGCWEIRGRLTWNDLYQGYLTIWRINTHYSVRISSHLSPQPTHRNSPSNERTVKQAVKHIQSNPLHLSVITLALRTIGFIALI